SLGASNGGTALQQAVQYAWNKGSVIVAAAGNAGNTKANYPAYYSEVIAVPPFEAPKRKLITFAPESAASRIPCATAS
ncbi:S8 family serine peptidase, partial [Bacillus sp. D-CC]